MFWPGVGEAQNSIGVPCHSAGCTLPSHALNLPFISECWHEAFQDRLVVKHVPVVNMCACLQKYLRSSMRSIPWQRKDVVCESMRSIGKSAICVCRFGTEGKDVLTLAQYLYSGVSTKAMNGNGSCLVE